MRAVQSAMPAAGAGRGASGKAGFAAGADACAEAGAGAEGESAAEGPSCPAQPAASAARISATGASPAQAGGAAGRRLGGAGARRAGHLPPDRNEAMSASDGPIRMIISGGTVKNIVPSVSLVGSLLAFSSARITRLSRISAA